MTPPGVGVDAAEYCRAVDELAGLEGEMSRLRTRASEARRRLEAAREKLTEHVGPNLRLRVWVGGGWAVVVRYTAEGRMADIDRVRTQPIAEE